MNKIVKVSLLVLLLQTTETLCWWFSFAPRADVQEKISERRELLYDAGAVDVTIPLHNGTTIQGLYLNRSNAPWCGVVFHGFAESKELYQPLVELFPHASWLLVDLKHRGGNRNLSLKDFDTVVQEVSATCNWLHKQKCNKRIAFGFSMGGIALIDSANACKMDGIILDGVASSLKKAAGEFGWYFRSPLLWGMSWFLPDGDIVKNIKKIQTPLFVMHALYDPVIPSYHAYTLHDAAKNSQLYLYSCNAHCRGHRLVPEAWKAEVNKFIESI
jgi:predicted esterase